MPILRKKAPEVTPEQREQREPRVSDFLTPAEAARLLGIHYTAVYFAMREGRLPTTEVLGKTVLRRTDVEAYTPRPNARRKGLSPL